MRSGKRFTGFTLIEILIVIAILGLLISAVMFQMVPQMQTGRDSRRKMDLYKIRNAIEQYYDTYSCFPVWLPACSSPMTIGEDVILPVMPCDPKTKTAYRYVTDGSACSCWYELYATLERESDADIDRLHCLSGCGPDCAYNYGITSSNRLLDRCAVLYVCAPGGGQTGSCQSFEEPERSQCPQVYENDPTCQLECGILANRCTNASGKSVPDKTIYCENQ